MIAFSGETPGGPMLISNELEGIKIIPRQYFDEALSAGMPLVRRPRQLLGKSHWLIPGGNTEKRLNRVKSNTQNEEEMLWLLTENLSLIPPDNDASPYNRTMALAVSEREGMRSHEITRELADKEFFPSGFTEAMHYFAAIKERSVLLGKVFHLRMLLRDKELYEWIVETIGLDRIKAKFYTPGKPFPGGSQFVVIKSEKRRK